MPGILSARWSGRHGDDDANTALLLGQLADVPDERRGAAFVCAAALVTPDGTERVLERQWRGTVIREKRGSNGFGYDPVFVPEGLSLTSAELEPGGEGRAQPPRPGVRRPRAGDRRDAAAALTISRR